MIKKFGIFVKENLGFELDKELIGHRILMEQENAEEMMYVLEKYLGTKENPLSIYDARLNQNYQEHLPNRVNELPYYYGVDGDHIMFSTSLTNKSDWLSDQTDGDYRVNIVHVLLSANTFKEDILLQWSPGYFTDLSYSDSQLIYQWYLKMVYNIETVSTDIVLTGSNFFN